MELRLPLEMSPGREAACRAVFGTWGFANDARKNCPFVLTSFTGWSSENVPKWLDKVGKFVSDTWEGIKKGTEEVWNGIKNFIGSTIDGIIGFFKNMWKTACDYVNKTIDKLQELNPFQERSEDGGVWWHDFIHGDPTAGIVGTHALPTYNINSEQKNNITINTNESAKAVKKTVERYSKDLIPSYVPQMN